MRAKVISAIILIVITIGLYRNFIINVSPSEPLGIYKIERTAEVQRGELVAVCLPFKYQELGLKQNYLLPGMRCDKSAPLLKTIVAIPGDNVILKNDRIIVNGKIFFYNTKLFDSHGRKLEKVARRAYKNTSEYWLIGTNSPNSWDSRYWGGIDRRFILYKLYYLSCNHSLVVR